MRRYLTSHILIKTLLLLVLLTNSNNVFSQTIITPDPLYTNVNNSGPGVYDITSLNPSFNNSDGSQVILNRYTNFEVGAGDQANILLNGSQTSINVVNGGTGTQIQGILNSLTGASGSPIGGNIIFIDPAGITLLPGSQLNAGSILLSATGSTIFSLGPGLQPQADLNNIINDPDLFLQGIDLGGISRFNSASGPIVIVGDINSSAASSLLGTSRGVYLFGSWISISGDINTSPGSHVVGITSETTTWNGATNTATATFPFPPGSMQGQIWLDGTINAPEGFVNFQANTQDLMNNFINLTGQINATAITPGLSGGEVVLRTLEPAGGLIMLDGLPFGQGIIQSSGLNTGHGGLVEIQTSRLEIVGGGFIDALNGNNSTTGGTISLSTPSGAATTEISNVGFITPSSVSSIFLTNLMAQPLAEGNFLLSGNPMFPGINIQEITIFPDGANVNLLSPGGDININSGTGMFPNRVYRELTFEGGDIFFNGGFRTTYGDINLISDTGNFNLSASSYLYAGSPGQILFTRDLTNGPISIVSNAQIITEASLNPLVVGNCCGGNYTETSITLNGSTFGTYANTYTSSETISVNPAEAPSLAVSEIQIILNSTSPSPSPAPSSTTTTSTSHTSSTISTNNTQICLPDNKKDKAITIAESANSDLTNTINTNNQTDTNLTTTSDNEPIITPENKIFSTSSNNDEINHTTSFIQINSLIQNGTSVKISELRMPEIFNICYEDRCKEYTAPSLGEYLIDVLNKGYPHKNEYEADYYGFIYSYQAGYNSKGLLGFLMTLQSIEEIFTNTNDENIANKTISYTHPATEKRVQKLENNINTFENKNEPIYKVNKKRYKKLLRIITD